MLMLEPLASARDRLRSCTGATTLGSVTMADVPNGFLPLRVPLKRD